MSNETSKMVDVKVGNRGWTRTLTGLQQMEGGTWEFLGEDLAAGQNRVREGTLVVTVWPTGKAIVSEVEAAVEPPGYGWLHRLMVVGWDHEGRQAVKSLLAYRLEGAKASPQREPAPALALGERESLASRQRRDLQIRLSKLPAWAQRHLEELERRARWAEQALQRQLDGQTESPFSTTRMRVDEAGKMHFDRHYLQSDNASVEVRHAGLEVSVMATRPDDGQRDYGVEVKFSGSGHTWGACVRPVPGGFMIVAPEQVKAELLRRRQWQEEAAQRPERRQAKGGAK